MARKKILESPEDLEGELSIEDLIVSNKNKYLIINLLAKRAREINDGGRPLVQLAEGAHLSPLEYAIGEAKQKALKIVKKEKEKVMVDLIGTTA